MPPIFISTILQGGIFLNLAHYFPYDVKLRLLAHSRSFLANQKARNAVVGAENLLTGDSSETETLYYLKENKKSRPNCLMETLNEVWENSKRRGDTRLSAFFFLQHFSLCQTSVSVFVRV